MDSGDGMAFNMLKGMGIAYGIVSKIFFQAVFVVNQLTLWTIEI